MLLGAFGVCGCLALPLAINIIRDIINEKEELNEKKEREERKKRGVPSLVDGHLPNRVEAAYDRDGDYKDELSFVTGEIIAVTGTSVIGIYSVFIICVIGQEDERWWEGYIESNPHRRGFFPADYVKSIENSETSSLRSSLFSILKQKLISFRIPFISNTIN